MHDEPTLFATASDCHRCGRPLRNSVCGWCTSAGTAVPVSRMRHATTYRKNVPDMREVRASRDEAVARVDANAEADWKTVACSIGYELATRRATFTSEDISDLIPPNLTTHEPRAMGAVMTRLRKAKAITPSDEFVMARSRVGHGRPSRVWISLIYGTEGETK